MYDMIYKLCRSDYHRISII